jgi:exodeoxyribonuclease VIII
MLKPTHDLSNEDYHKHPAISRSDLVRIQRSPRHFWQHKYGGGDSTSAAPSPALLFGTAVHAAVLEPELFKQTYIQAPALNKNTTAYKQVVADAREAGQILLSPEDFESIEGITASLHEHETATKAVYADGISEATFIAKDPGTGLELKCRADRVTESGWLVDLKTTIDAGEQAFSRTVANYGYHIQAAYYMHVVEVATGIRPRGFLFVAVEKTAPFGVQVFKASPDLVQSGHSVTMNGLYEIQKHISTHSTTTPWPCYTPGITTLELPKWAQH